MLGDAYFQLRAQIGTALFSLLRLAAEAEAPEENQAALRGMQSRLRESFTFAALGPEGAGKSALLNALFERDFSGAEAEPETTGKVAIFRHTDDPPETVPFDGTVECRRPHIFLRDFTIVEAPDSASIDSLAPLLARTDVIFYVVSVAGTPASVWDFLPRLGRVLLKRLVLVVWQSDRVSTEECASAVKKLRQAMLRNLGQACPIFIGAKSDAAGRDKLVRWIESEVIVSESRRARLQEIDEVARETLRQIVARPRAGSQALDREIDRVEQLRAELDDSQEQSHRFVAGALWSLAQSFDALRSGGESLLRSHLELTDFFWKRSVPANDFAHEIETQLHASFSLQLHDQLIALEGDLRLSAEEHLRGNKETGKAAPAKPPVFPRAALEETLMALDIPLDAARIVNEGFTDAVRTLQLPALAAAGAVAVAIGAALAGQSSPFLAGLAGAIVVFSMVLAFLLRRNVVAAFGRHFTVNRSTLLSALEPALSSAAEQFYAGFAPDLAGRADELAAERERFEPLLVRLQQIEQTFSRIATDLRTGLARPEAGEDL